MGTPLKRTPLHDIHVKLGARLVPFGGWEMPVQHTSDHRGAPGGPLRRGALRRTMLVTEARELGIERRLLETCGQPIRWWNVYVGSTLQSRRDLIATTPAHIGGLDFYHPEMEPIDRPGGTHLAASP